MTQRRTLYLVLLIIGLGFALRLYQLDARPFWFDEGLSVDLAAAPPHYVLQTIDRPPLHYLLLHDWVGVAGNSPFALRFFSAWWGTLALVPFYLLARQLVDRRLSVWALLLAALSPFYVYYAQEARTYSLTFTFALLSCWAMLVWLKTKRSRYLILNAAATLVCLYTHYSLLLLPAAQSVFVLIVTWHDFQPPGRYVPISADLGLYFLPLPYQLRPLFLQLKRPVQWIVAHIIVGLLFLPWPWYAQRGLPELIAPHIQSALSPAWLSGPLFVWKTLLEFSAGQVLAWPLGEAIALVLVFLIGWGLLSSQLARQARIFLALWLLFPPLIMLLLPRTSIYYEPKYLMMITPAVYLLAVVGASELWPKKRHGDAVSTRFARLHIFSRRLLATLSVTWAAGVLLVFGRMASLPIFQMPEPAQGIAETAPAAATITSFHPTPYPPYPTPVPFFNTTPARTGQFIRSFWSDTASSYQQLGRLVGVSVTEAGSALSYFHPLPISYRNITVSPDNHVYFWSDNKQIDVYDPAHDTVERVSLPYPDPAWITSLTIAPDARVYGVATYGGYKDRHDRLFAYDPDTHVIADLTVVSPTKQLVAGANGRLYGFSEPYGLDRPPFVYDPASGVMKTLDMPIQPGKHLADIQPVWGEDDLIYGTVYSPTISGYSTSFLFALNTTNGTIITAPIPAKVWVMTIAPRADRGVYLGTTQGIWSFDPIRQQLMLLPTPANYGQFSVWGLSARRNGQLYGFGYAYGVPSEQGGYLSGTYGAYLFSFNPNTQQIKQLERIVQLTYSDDKLNSGPNDRAYLTMRYRVHYYDPGQHVLTGTVQSQRIAPLAVVLTRTYVSQQYASVEKLTCGADDKLYGVKSTPVSEDWLFWYDPKTPDRVEQVAPTIAREDQQPFAGGTTLLALPDGRLVGGAYNGHLFTYTPATHTTLDLGRPVSGTYRIASLVQGPDGLVYGGTTSYQAGRLFAFDPATHVITDITLPVTATYEMAALTTAQGRIYAGGGHQLVVYDPSTRQASLLGAPQNCSFHTLAAGPDGLIYAGCDNKLLAYHPQTAEVTLIGATPGAEIRSLIVGNDGKIYGSYFRDYGGRCMANCIASSVFAYDPVVGRMMDLGMAVSTGPAVLAACGDGIIYGGSNSTNSNYRGPAYLFAFRTDCPTGPVGTWDRLTWEAETPPGTDLNVDVLDTYGRPLLTHAPNGGSLQAINPISNTVISLRANLSTTDLSMTPVLKNWRVDYVFACANQPPSEQR